MSATCLVLAFLATLGLVAPAQAATKVAVSLIVSPIAPKNLTLQFSGRVSHVGSPATKVVRLQLKKGKHWKTVASRHLSRKATYTFKRKMTKTGSFAYRTRSYRGKKLLATSPVRRVKVSSRIAPPGLPTASQAAKTSRVRGVRQTEISRVATGATTGALICDDSLLNSVQANHPFVTAAGNQVSWWYANLWIDRTAGSEPFFPWRDGRFFYYDPATYTWYDYLTFAPSAGVVWSSLLPGQYMAYNYIFAADGDGRYDLYTGFSSPSCSIYD